MRDSILLSWATQDFTQGRTAKLHTQGAWRLQKARFWQKTTYGTHRNQSRGFVGSMHWKIQPTGYKQKYNHNKEHGKMVSLVHFLQCWASKWGLSSHMSTVPFSPVAQSSAHTVSSTFCTYCGAPHSVCSYEPVSKRPPANRIRMWLSKCHFIFKIQ